MTPLGGSYADPSGTWMVYLSSLVHYLDDTDPKEYTDVCTIYEDVEIRLSGVEWQSPAAPPPPIATPAGSENDQRCAPGATAQTRFQLVRFPGTRHAELLPVGGDPAFAGASLTSVSVSNWHNAGSLELRNGLAVQHLAPGSAPLVLPPGSNWWLGAISWDARLEGSAAAFFQQPEVLVTHTCPNGPAPSPLWLPVGYGISLASLRAGVATALTGLSLSTSLVTQGPADSWPVYAVRIEPAPPGATDGRTHVLRLDLRASRSTAALPLVQAGAGVYYLDAILANPPIELHGQVLEEAASLTLQLQSGVWFSPGGDVALNPASATLPRLGGTNGGGSGSQP